MAVFHNKRVRQASGFTLIELLAVVIILGILAAIAIIGVSNARDAAYEKACVTSLKEIAAAADAYYLQGDGDPATIGTYPSDPKTLFDNKFLRSNPNVQADGVTEADIVFSIDSAGVVTANDKTGKLNSDCQLVPAA